jgi:hypothetical protein
MFIFVVNFKTKSGVTENDLIRLHNEIAAPIYSKTIGCKGTYLIKYTGRGDESPEWDYCKFRLSSPIFPG